MLRIFQRVYLQHPPILAKGWQRLEGTLHGTCLGFGKVLIDKAAEFEACYLGIYSAKRFTISDGLRRRPMFVGPWYDILGCQSQLAHRTPLHQRSRPRPKIMTPAVRANSLRPSCAGCWHDWTFSEAGDWMQCLELRSFNRIVQILNLGLSTPNRRSISDRNRDVRGGDVAEVDEFAQLLAEGCKRDASNFDYASLVAGGTWKARIASWCCRWWIWSPGNGEWNPQPRSEVPMRKVRYLDLMISDWILLTVGPTGDTYQIWMMIGNWLFHSHLSAHLVPYRQGPSVKDAIARVCGEASDTPAAKPSKRCGYRARFDHGKKAC